MKNILAAISVVIINQAHLFAADTTRIYFRHDDKSITENLRLLDSVAALKNVSSIHILGFTDHLGTNEYNLVLSRQRAQNVKNYLSTKISSVHITAEGKGEIQALKNLSSGEPKNRRAEIIIYLNKTQTVPEPKAKTEPQKAVTDINKIAELEVGQKLVLNTFHFIGGRHFLLPQYINQLDTLVKALHKNRSLVIEIQGFVCCTQEYDGLDYDTGEYNLSVNRAKYIYDELVKRGINRNRLYYKGYGSTKPIIYPEITEEDKTTNRRVEIKILSK